MELRTAYVVVLAIAIVGIVNTQTGNDTAVGFEAGQDGNTSAISTTDSTGVTPDTSIKITDAASTLDSTGASRITSTSAATVTIEDSDVTTIVSPEILNLVSNVENAIDTIRDVIEVGGTVTEKTTVSEEVPETTKFEDTTVTTKKVEATTEVVSETTPEVVTDVPKQTFKEAEKEITDFINSILRSLLPRIVGGSGGAKLSPRCTAGMMKIFGYIRRMKGWTLKILDSMGKPSSGILKGRAYSMGNYDECLDLSVTSKGVETSDPKDEMFRGKYCRVRIQFPEIVIETARNYHKGLVNASDLGRLKDTIQVIPFIPVKSNYMSHFLGMCFPSSCTTEDLEELVKLIPFPGKSSLDRCEVKMETEVDNTQLIILCIFAILILFAVVSTLIDWILHSKRQQKSLSPDDDNRFVSVSVAFSICTNTKRLLKNIEDDAEGILAGQSVRGIFVASVAWIILGHTYLLPQTGYYLAMSSLANLRNYWNEGYFTTIMSFPLAIDALFVCYGFLFTFSLWQPTLKSRDVSINVISLIIKNYIRLCLPLFICYGIIYLLPLIGSGPFWGDLLEGSRERCRESIGAHFGMYSNFLDIKDQCFPHLWFVSCLAQLTLAGIFLSCILSRSMKMGVFVLLLITIACNTTIGIITFNNNLPPSYVAYFTEESSSWFWKINMALPLSHFGAYAAGMLAGVLIARRDYHRARMCLAVVGWIACLGILYAIELVLHNSRDGSLDSQWSAAFASIHRTLFGVCVSWVMVACSYGLGGFVNSILSCRIFDPLFRLSYYAYIFHYLVISFVVSVSREHLSYGHLELILRAFSYIAATYFVVYFLYMLLEMPLTSLKAACCPKKTCQLEVTTLNNFPMHKGDVISKNSMEGSCKLWSITESHNPVTY